MTIGRPIGIFDSGLGGLTVAKQVLNRLPHESIAYVADQIHVPYGEKSPDEIRSFALGITDFLVRSGAKLIIMACNMSSATALEAASELFPDTPVLGVIEAGARAAARAHEAGPIGVLATRGTVSTRAYTRTLETILPHVTVIEQACPKFVPLVEAGRCDTPEAEEAVREYVEPLMADGCRTFILGCTHYPFLYDTIRRVVGSEAIIIDPADETVVEAENVLLRGGLLEPPHAGPVHRFFTTDQPEAFADLGSRFLGRPVCGVQRISWGLDLGEIEWQEKTDERITRSAR